MINIAMPDSEVQQQPRIAVFGVGGAGGNAVNNMINAQLNGIEFIVANTDAQALTNSRTPKRIQLGSQLTRGLGAGARPDVGRASAEEELEEIKTYLKDCNMAFITAGMGGGTGTGAAPVIARTAREAGILTVGVVTKPFLFEGQHRMRTAESGIAELQQYVDTLIIIPNQNLFRVANEKTTFADAFRMADDVLHAGVRGITDLMMMPGLINLDFADIRTVMSEMGKAMMGTGEASGESRAIQAAEAAISNPLLDDVSLKGARAMLINITGGDDIALFEVDEAVNRIRDEVDPDANIIFGSTFDPTMNGRMRVSVVATGIETQQQQAQNQTRTTIVMPGIDTLRKPVISPAPVSVGTSRSSAAADYLGRLVASPLHASPPVQKPAGNGSLSPDTIQTPSYPAHQAEQQDVAEATSEGTAATQGENSLEQEEAFQAAAPPQANTSALNSSQPVAEEWDTLMPPRTMPSSTEYPSQNYQERSSRPSLFARMTGLASSARRSREEQSAPPSANPRGERRSPVPGQPSAQEKQRTPVIEDEVLDIPAFLRRQSN